MFLRSIQDRACIYTFLWLQNILLCNYTIYFILFCCYNRHELLLEILFFTITSSATMNIFCTWILKHMCIWFFKYIHRKWIDRSYTRCKISLSCNRQNMLPLVKVKCLHYLLSLPTLNIIIHFIFCHFTSRGCTNICTGISLWFHLIFL